jgi:5-methylcytosine-specific restriction protein B
MRHKVIPLLAEYFYEDWSKVAAVLGDGNGTGEARFLESRKLSLPEGFWDNEFGEEKRRWTLKSQFDFSEFEV